MTRTCSQCSAYHTDDCPFASFDITIDDPVCEAPVNGWDVEWRASGMHWRLNSMGWNLYVGDKWYGYLSSLDWYESQPERDLIHRDARRFAAKTIEFAPSSRA